MRSACRHAAKAESYKPRSPNFEPQTSNLKPQTSHLPCIFARVKIAVNTRLLLSGKLEGIGWFTYEIFQRLTREHPEVEWIFIFDRPYDPQFVFADNVRPVVIGPQSRHPVLWYLWFEWSLTRLLKKEQPDLFVSPDGYLSLRTQVKSLPVIHDLNFEHYPEKLPVLVRKYYRHYFPRFARHATRIATVSEYSRQDISRTYGIDDQKIDLVYNGCGDFFHPIPLDEQEKVRQEISQGEEYFIFIGALNPRKNITGMLRAFSNYRNTGGKSKLVIVGEKMFWSSDIEEAYQNHPHKSEVIFTGRLEGDALNRVLASASALLFVSHFEGFGIPVVEAFQCEVPVITSTATSLPEVAGNAALLCDPENYQQIAEAMHRIGDQKLRKSLIAKGKERVKEFTWQRSATMMWDSIKKALEQ